MLSSISDLTFLLERYVLQISLNNLSNNKVIYESYNISFIDETLDKETCPPSTCMYYHYAKR